MFILSILSEKYDKNNIGLYRDDRLSIFKYIKLPTSENIKRNDKIDLENTKNLFKESTTYYEQALKNS